MGSRGWEHLTVHDVLKLGRQKAQPKPSKYKNVRCVVDGEKFDSKSEAAIWLQLKARERAGEIYMLTRQVAHRLYCPVLRSKLGGMEAVPGLQAEVCSYVSDFEYVDSATGQHHVLDRKGHRTREYLLKAKWMNLQYGIVIEEV